MTLLKPTTRSEGRVVWMNAFRVASFFIRRHNQGAYFLMRLLESSEAKAALAGTVVSGGSSDHTHR